MTYGYIKFFDNYRLLPSSLSKLVKNLDIDDFEILKKELPDKRMYLNEKLANLHEYFKSSEDYQKPVVNLKKEGFFQ